MHEALNVFVYVGLGIWFVIQYVSKPIRRPYMIPFFRAASLPFLAAMFYAILTRQF